MEDLFQNHQDIQEIDIEESVKNSYLDYSMSVIIGRALPDARDGLKPVHRRILYAMHELGLHSKAPYKKSARIVGDVIGKYHPHGDSAVYEALVRMAQPFSMRLPLVDGQGNFGSIDGDNAAAMRYTEARMRPLAEELLRDIDKDTVDFVPNYDESLSEPDVLPARVPNLLLNGSSGIAVGMATNIPPHRLDELVDALVLLIERPGADLSEVMEHIQGPDFPTGGIIYGKQGIIAAYRSGRGRIKIRAKTTFERSKNKEAIVITEIPYQVNKARLVEQIASLVREKQIEGIAEIRDESDREGVRVVIELKKDAIPEIVLNNLYKQTQMEITFGINLLAIHNKEPKVFTLLDLLHLFLNHRRTVVIRRTIFELERARARLHIVEGLLKALENIDGVVGDIKGSHDAQAARGALMDRLGLSEAQSGAILEMRLQRLTGLEQERLDQEHRQLLQKIDELQQILKDEGKLNAIIKEELLEIKERFSTPRLTQIVEDYDEIEIEDLIPNEPMVVTITHRGYIKRTPLKLYEKQKRGGKGKTAVITYEDDFIEDFFVSNAHDTLMFITDRGQLYWLKVYRIPEAGRNAKGKAVVNLLQLEPNEKIKAIIPTTDFSEDKSLAFFTKNGIVKRTNLAEFSNIRSKGVRAITLDENDELVTAKIVDPKTRWLFIITHKGMCIRFRVEDVREMGRTARGVTGIRFKFEGDYVVGAETIYNEEQELLTVSEKGIGKRTEAREYREQSRGGKGVIAMKLTPRTGNVVGVVSVEEDKDLMVLTSKGKMIRVDMESIRKAGRNTSGVMIVRVESGDKVVSIAKCPKEEKEEVDENL
ncbi:MAG: DNA gyrase subunit A [Nitratiruptor sp.]|nr:DNA gyrase subunit A [Nitratiruptor sp.]NPA82905.1 DNA gyrase subunit A [Campylobacterota bacterium]